MNYAKTTIIVYARLGEEWTKVMTEHVVDGKESALFQEETELVEKADLPVDVRNAFDGAEEGDEGDEGFKECREHILGILRRLDKEGFADLGGDLEELARLVYDWDVSNFAGDELPDIEAIKAILEAWSELNGLAVMGYKNKDKKEL